ncbi:MAG: hypothetical protein ACLVJ6_00320 [Merdibacter sp.]
MELPATAKQEENRLNVATVDHAGNRCNRRSSSTRIDGTEDPVSDDRRGGCAEKESGYSLFPMAGAQLCVQTQDLFADAIGELTMIAADGEKTVQRIAGDAQGMAVFAAGWL